jgi:hypothetical protein
MPPDDPPRLSATSRQIAWQHHFSDIPWDSQDELEALEQLCSLGTKVLIQQAMERSKMV